MMEGGGSVGLLLRIYFITNELLKIVKFIGNTDDVALEVSCDLDLATQPRSAATTPVRKAVDHRSKHT